MLGESDANAALLAPRPSVSARIGPLCAAARDRGRLGTRPRRHRDRGRLRRRAPLRPHPRRRTASARPGARRVHRHGEQEPRARAQARLDGRPRIARRRNRASAPDRGPPRRCDRADRIRALPRLGRVRTPHPPHAHAVPSTTRTAPGNARRTRARRDPVGISAGLRVLLELPPSSPPAEALVSEAAARSIELFPVGRCYHAGHAPEGRDGLVLGYAALPEHDFEPALEALGNLLDTTPAGRRNRVVGSDRRPSRRCGWGTGRSLGRRGRSERDRPR
jgi:hypothetical protein